MTLTVTRVRAAALCAVLAAAAFAQEPGRVVPDTKLDLTVDPGAFLGRALHLWDPQAAFGGLQNQAYGYLFPMGPFFALAHWAHVPGWVAQRLWWTLLLCTAFLGVLRLLGRLRIGTSTARLLGALAYALAPRVLSELGGISAELLPLALVPWTVLPLVAVAQGRASPRRGAALSGVAVLLMGGVNAAATLAALVVPALYLLTRRRSVAVLRLAGWWAGSVLLACAWWLAPLLLLGRYGYRFVDHIESAANTTAHTSLLEVLRGTSQWLGYVLVNGRPPWPAAWYLTTYPGVVLQTAVLAGLGLAGLALRRMPERRFALACLLVGALLVTAGHVGSLDGGLAAATRSALDGVLAPLRNVHKADPVLRMALALGVTHAVTVLARRLSTTRRPSLQGLARHSTTVVVGLVGLLVAGTAVPALAGRVSPPGAYTAVPAAWGQAADWLRAHDDGGRALVLPAASFAEFTWGTTKDEPLQALLGDGPTWAVRDAVPIGSDGSTRLMDSWSAIVDTGRGSPGLAPSLARAGVRYLVVRDGLDPAATGAPAPWRVRTALAASPGLTRVAAFGRRSAPAADGAAVGPVTVPPEAALATGELPEVEVWRVDGVVARATAAPLDGLDGVAVLSGGPEALPDLLGSGLLTGRAVVLSGDAGGSTSPGGGWILTDTLRHRLNGYGDVRRAVGPTAAVDDPLEQRRVPDFLPYPGVAHQTTSVLSAGATVAASSTAADPGEPSRYDLAARPVSAFDGDQATAWMSGPLRTDRTEWVEAAWPTSVGPGPVTVWLGTGAELDATVTHVTVQTDTARVGAPVPVGTDRVTVTLTAATRHLKLLLDRVVATGADPRVSVVDVAVAGAAPVTDALLPPDDVPPAVRARGPSVILLARSATSQAGCVDAAGDLVCIPGSGTTGEEARGLDRVLVLDRASSWTASGRAVVVPGPALDRLVYGTAGVQATASSRLSAEPADAPGAAVDGSTATAWTAAPDDRAPTLTLAWTGLRTVSSVRLLDGRSAGLPGPVTVTVEVGGRTFRQDLAAGGTVAFPPVLADRLVLRADRWPGGLRVVGRVPFSVGEVVVPGVTPSSDRTTGEIVLPCGSGPALSVGGVAVPTSASGRVADVLATGTLTWAACAHLVLAAASNHVYAAGDGPIAVDSLVAVPATPTGAAGRVTPVDRTVTVVDWSDSLRTLRVAAGPAAVLSVPENANAGWTAVADGHVLEPLRVDGWAQGWVLPAGAGGTVTLTFGPDRTYRLTLVLGLLLAVVLLSLALLPDRSRSGRPSRRPDPATAATFAPLALEATGTALVGFLLCGWLGAVVLGGAAVLGRRSLPLPAWVVPAAAGGSLVLAGLLGALAPWPSDHPAADGVVTQALCLLALAAVVVGGGGPTVRRPLGRPLDQAPAERRDGQAQGQGQPEHQPEAAGEGGRPGQPQDHLDHQQVPQEQ